MKYATLTKATIRPDNAEERNMLYKLFVILDIEFNVDDDGDFHISINEQVGTI